MGELLEVVNKLGGASFATLLSVILWANFKGIWTWSRDLEAMRLDRDRWQQMALRNLGVAENAVSHAQRLTTNSPGSPA